MPRTADPKLPHRILKAADALWQSGGEEAVTIRGVAAQAATTTPTVYSYYADREALLTALRGLAFARFSAYLAKSRDFKDACARISNSAPAIRAIMNCSTGAAGWSVSQRMRSGARSNATPAIWCAPVSMQAGPRTSPIRS